MLTGMCGDRARFFCLAAEVDVADSGHGLAEEGRAEALEFFDGIGGVEEAGLSFEF